MTVTPEGLVKMFSNEFGKYPLGSRNVDFFTKYGYKEKDVFELFKEKNELSVKYNGEKYTLKLDNPYITIAPSFLTNTVFARALFRGLNIRLPKKEKTRNK
ncbi:MAG: hypothetical protein KKB25_02495 [Nanoarchaeota archaeon]|nr:hypothetical protein [Nanoarchaeota archaeon]